MSSIKTKFRRFVYKLKHDFLTIENIVLVVAIVLCLAWTFQSIKAMSRNWELSKRLTAERKTHELLNLEIQTAELENAYYQTAEYQELAARQKLDKKLAGENMVVMPENSVAARTKHQTSPTTTSGREYTNFEEWMLYLFPHY